jgi:drug/metabolite transporter (DMT)-like permease
VKTALLIAIIVLADSAGDVLLTKGMRQVGEVSTFAPRALLAISRRAIRNHHVLASLVFMVTHFVGFLAVLSWADLSVVFPATTLVYVLGTLTAKFILQERISLHRWAGTMLVCLGVGLVSLP